MFFWRRDHRRQPQARLRQRMAKVKGGLFSALQNKTATSAIAAGAAGLNAAVKSEGQFQHQHAAAMTGAAGTVRAPSSRRDNGPTTTPGRAAAGAEILNIINHGNDIGGGSGSGTKRDVVYDFSCSPPARASNPLCQDRAFGKFYAKVDSRRDMGATDRQGRLFKDSGHNMSV